MWFRVSVIIYLWKCTCDDLFDGMKLKLSSWLFIHSGMYDEYVVIVGMQVEFLVKLVIWDMCFCGSKNCINCLIIDVFCIIFPGDIISPKREWLRVATMLSWLFLPRREVPRPSEKVVSLKRGYGCPGEKAPGVSVLSGVFFPRREIFRPSDEVFSPRREYFS